MNEDLLENNPFTAKLPDGRLVVMRELTGADEYVVERYLSKQGAKPEGFGMISYIKMLAMQALVSVGDTNYQTAKAPEELVSRQMEFKSRELAIILKLYNSVNGAGDSEAKNDGSTE